MARQFSICIIIFAAISCGRNEITIEEHEGYSLAVQSKGPAIGYSSAPTILEDGFLFRDLDRNGVLTPYEDWRLPSIERAKDLASRLSIEQICGLMIYSSAQRINESELSEKQKCFLGEDHVRHVLVSDIAEPGLGARWANNVQSFCEAEPLGIPANNSTDPRNYTNGKTNTSTYNHEPDGEFDPDGSSNISRWPRELGIGATFDMDVVRKHGEVVSAEYRALGITTALSPQIDIASDPRWRRFYGSFSEDPYLNRDIAREYCDAFQTTPGSKTGWGQASVNCMVKHWPGGGSGEGGRDAHFGIGKYAVYPGGNFALGLIPFTEGAFKLRGKTKMASAVMPYYTISYGQDPGGENLPSGDLDRHEVLAGISNCETAHKFILGTPRLFVEIPYFFHFGNCFLQGAAEGDEQFIQGIEIKLDDISADTQVTKGKVIGAGILIVHVEHLQTGCEDSVDFRLHCGDFNPGTED